MEPIRRSVRVLPPLAYVRLRTSSWIQNKKERPGGPLLLVQPACVSATPDAGADYWTTMVAIMFAWYWQWYLYVPGLVKVKLKVWPESRLPESKEPLAWQVWKEYASMHCVSPGEHTPPQVPPTPPMHAFVHVLSRKVPLA